MPNEAPPPAPPAPPSPPPPPAPAWYEGKATPEIIGHWDNKNWNKADPVTIALEASKQAWAAQQSFGVPIENMLKLPAAATDEKGWNDVYSRLGVPAKAEEYDLSAIKRADGSALDETLSAALRGALFNSRTPKDRAVESAKPVLKYLDDAATAAAAERTARVQAEQAKLKADWGANGQNFDVNKLTALQGARRLGMTPEEFNAMEATPGGARFMEMMRLVGKGTTEDNFREGGQQSPTTQNGAQARLAELMADPEWGKRLVAGGAAELREFRNLNEIIVGVAA